jgi:hypothetical protein
MTRKAIILLGVLILLNCIVHFRWVINHGAMTHGDWYPINIQSVDSFIRVPMVWSYEALGSVSLSNSSHLLFTTLAWFSKIFSYPSAQKLTLLFPIIILGILSPYLLFSYNFKSKLAVFTATIIYNFNTYFLMLQTGHLTLALAFSFAPIVILLYQKTLSNQTLNWAVLCGLAGWILGIFEFRALYLTLLICASYYIFSAAISRKKKLLDNAKSIKLAFFGIIPIIIIILLNLYWLVPSFSTGSISSNQFFSRDLFGQQFSQITYALTLHHPFWTNTKYESFHLQQIPIIAWITPLLFSISVFLRSKHKISLFYALIALIGVFLVKHLNPPIGMIYQWLYDYLPGFNAFRESSKFYFLIMLGYAGSIGSLIEYVQQKYIGNLSKYFSPIIVLIAIVPFLSNTKPLINGEIGTLFIERSIPSDYQLLNNYIDAEQSFFRTMWIPTQSRWGAYTADHPIISIVNLIYNHSSQLYSNSPDSVKIENQIINLIEDENFPRILDKSQVKYLIIPTRDTDNDDDFFINYGNNREMFIDSLSQQTYLKKIDIGSKELVLFEYINFSDEGLIGVSNSINKQIEIINPTNILVNFITTEDIIDIHLFQSFNRGWIATSEDAGTQIEILPQSELDQIFTNSFRVSKNTSLSSEDTTVNISFQPQDAMNRYLKVSLLTLLICLLYLSYKMIKLCLKK